MILLCICFKHCFKQYDRYFRVNAVDNGGSFYLQSKVFRAKEQLDEFIKEKKMEGS